MDEVTGTPAAEPAPPEVPEAPPAGKKKKRDAAVVLLTAQGLVCLVALLTVLVLKAFGAPLYDDLCGRFRAAMADNSLSATVSSWFSSDSEETHV